MNHLKTYLKRYQYEFYNKRMRWMVVHFCVFLILVFSACNGHEQLKNNSESIKQIYAPVKVLLDTVPPPKSIDLKSGPPPEVVNVPKMDGGFYTLKTENGEEKIQLKSPVIIKAPLPLADFTNFNTGQGLASSTINASMMDKKGQLWFSTGNYVSRYDGNRFSNFTIGQGNTVYGILEDNSGNIWFGTAGGGVYRYDGIRFTNFTVSDGLANDIVLRIIQDKKGNIWISTYGGGVSRFDGKSFSTFNIEQGLASNIVGPILEDKSGNIWFGTYGQGVSRFDGSRFKTFTTENGLTNNNVFCIIQDKSGNIWFGTQEGVSRFDPLSGGATFTTLNIGNGLLSYNINDIAEDKSGNIWFATIGGGAVRYDGTQFTIFTTEQGLANNKVCNITEDKKGNIWFGTEGGGLSRYNGKSFNSFTPKQGLLKNQVYSIAEDKKGNLWFATFGGGISRFDGASFVSFTTNQGLASNEVFSILPDQGENMWFSTQKGICYYDDRLNDEVGQGKSFTNFTTRQGLVHNSVTSSLQDKAGIFWFGTIGGVSRFDGKSFTNFTILQGLANNFVSAIAEGPDGNLWFGTEGGGVSRFDGKSFATYTVEQGLAHNIVKNILKDRSGNLWFCTLGGVSRFDGSGFLSYSTIQGLANDFVSVMAEDEQGVIWFGTDNGLSSLKFNTSSAGNNPGEIKGAGVLKESNEILKTYEPVWNIYNNQTGYPVKDLIEKAMYIKKLGFPLGNKKDKGVIWGGCSDDNVIRFEPEAVIKSNETHIPLLQSIEINETSLNWYSLGQKTKDSILIAQQEVLVYGKLLPGIVRDSLQRKFADIRFDSITPFYQIPLHLVLSYNHNRLSINFGTVETNRNYMVRYQYLLEGYDKEWSPITEKRTASYGNIAEGSYTFKLKSLSPEGVWSEPIEYSFKVLPPWWRTLWAYALYSLAFAYCIRTYTSFRSRKLEQTNLALVEKVNMQQSLINERARISRELHDEIGSTLSGISMYSHLATKQLLSTPIEEVSASLTIMQSSANEMVNKLQDIVWLTNPDQDSLQKLIQRLEEYAHQMASVKNIKVLFNVQKSISEYNLPVEIRRNIYLFCKEAINNAVKYSKGTLLELEIQEVNKRLKITIRDNGLGFDPDNIKSGNGLANMYKRADMIRAELSIKSANEKGCEITLQL